VIESVELLDRETVDKFLPPYKRRYTLDPDNPVTMGCFAAPNMYTETRKDLDNAVRESKKVILDVWRKFGELTGRNYKPVEQYKTDKAETLLVLAGGYSENAMDAIDKLQGEGKKVGLVRVRLWRPFPHDEIKEALAGAGNIIVLDRAISLGGPGPICSEIRDALYSLDKKPKIAGIVGGLGGRDVSPADFEKIIEIGLDRINSGRTDETYMYGVRE
jgi:pyruvate ferredoxin oxidoreductase alpha subunit